MFCPQCGTDVLDGSAICPSCGAQLNAQSANATYAQPAQAPYAQPVPSKPPVVDSGSIGWGILGFFIPIVGLILFFVWRNNKPKSAKVAIIGAAIGFVVNLIITFGMGS